jgi:hypothetical protein
LGLPGTIAIISHPLNAKIKMGERMAADMSEMREMVPTEIACGERRIWTALSLIYIKDNGSSWNRVGDFWR